MTSFLTPNQSVELIAALQASEPSREPIDLAITLIMNRRDCSQCEAFAVLRDLRPGIVTVSEVPVLRTQLTADGLPQERWEWVATGA